MIERGKLQARGGARQGAGRPRADGTNVTLKSPSGTNVVTLKSRDNNQSDNTSRRDVTLKSRGNSSAYTLARLDRDRPDLAAKVDARLMSANAAAIEAGFRKAPLRREDLAEAYGPRAVPAGPPPRIEVSPDAIAAARRAILAGKQFEFISGKLPFDD